MKAVVMLSPFARTPRDVKPFGERLSEIPLFSISCRFQSIYWIKSETFIHVYAMLEAAGDIMEVLFCESSEIGPNGVGVSFLWNEELPPLDTFCIFPMTIMKALQEIKGISFEK